MCKDQYLLITLGILQFLLIFNAKKKEFMEKSTEAGKLNSDEGQDKRIERYMVGFQKSL